MENIYFFFFFFVMVVSGAVLMMNIKFKEQKSSLISSIKRRMELFWSIWLRCNELDNQIKVPFDYFFCDMLLYE